MELMDMDGDSFEMGGMDTMPPFLQNMFGNLSQSSEASKEPHDIVPVSEKEEKSETTRKRNNKNKDAKRKFLTAYCTNLTARAELGQLDEVIGRAK